MKKIFFVFCLFFALAASSVYAASATNSVLSIFPPQNPSAAGGLLYFPEGGPGSVYAAPVLSDQRIITALQEIRDKVEAASTSAASTRWQCSNLNCVDIRTGVVCSYTPTSRTWTCPTELRGEPSPNNGWPGP